MNATETDRYRYTPYQFSKISKRTHDKREVGKLFRYVEDLFQQGDFETCNQLLRDTNVGKLPTLLQVGMLRITYRAKHKLNSWEYLLERVRVSVVERGLDPDELLRGLIKEQS